MKKVIFPLRKNDTGAEVVNLQDVLSLMIKKGTIKLSDPRLLRTWRTERASKAYGTITIELVKHFQQTRELRESGEVKKATASAINKLLHEWNIIRQPPQPESEYTVQGQILQADKTPLSGVLVRAFSKELRNETMLAEAVTDRRGNYSITCTQSSNKESVNFIIRVFDRRKNFLASSRTIFNAETSETVDIQIAEESKRLESKYERIIRALKPLLKDRPIRKLREEEEDNPEKGKVRELSYLAGETGISVNHLSTLVAAEKMAASTQMSPEICYALLRKGMSTDLYALGEQGKNKLRKTLEQAVEEQLVPASVQLDRELEKLFRRPEIQLLNKPMFLVKPEILFTPLAGRNTLKEQERHMVNAKLNRKFQEIMRGTVSGLSESMHRALQDAVEHLDYQECQDLDPAALLRDSILPRLKKNPELAKEAAELKDKLQDRGQTVSQLLHLDKPLQNNPLFFDHIRRAKTLTYTGLAGMSEEAKSHLADTDLTPDDRVLVDMVKRALVTKQQADDLLLTLDLARLTGDNLPLIENVRGAGLISTREMISWDKEDWLRRISTAGESLPPAEKPETYADNIIANIELTYPSQTLLFRMTAPKQSERAARIDRLHPLLDRCERLIEGRRPTALDGHGLGETERRKLETDLEDLTALANTYRHLEFTDLINDREKTSAEKKTIMRGRLSQLDTFNRNNEKLDLRLVNFTQKNNEQINWQDISEDEQPRLRKQLMAFQRTLVLAPKTADRQLMLSKGFDSCQAVVRCSEAQFIKSSGLAKDVGQKTYAQAATTASSIAHVNESIREIGSGGLTEIGLANNLRKIPLYNALRDIDGMEDLFGSLNYCACEECSSILGPAAYFVDLMKFIDENITSEVQKQHPFFFLNSLHLKRRRRDLWELPLTCENTHTLIPYLTIVNEVLTTYLEQLLGIKKGEAFKELSKEKNKISFQLPFNLPLNELRIYLGHFGITLFELYRFLDLPTDKIWPARLDLSAQEVTIISTPDKNNIKKRYGSPASLDTFDVQEFLRRTGIDRDQLDDLCKLKFNPNLKKIVIHKKYEPDEIQSSNEYLDGLQKDRLDFIHRFIRLWKKTNWTIQEFDFILCALAYKDTKPSIPVILGIIEEETVEEVAQLAELQKSLKLSPEELCALVNQLPVSSSFPKKAATPSKKRLMDALFDVEVLFADENYYHYSLDENPNDPQETEPKTPILLGGLGINETELLLLFKLLKESMPFDENGKTSLDKEKLSLLYRHAKLAKALKWDVEEFLLALELLFGPETPIKKLEDIYTLQEFKNWLDSSSFTVFDLALLIQNTESRHTAFSSDLDDTAAFISGYQKIEGPAFTGELLAEIDGITKEDSVAVLKLMAEKNLLIPSAEGYRVNPDNYLLNHNFTSVFGHPEVRSEVKGKEIKLRGKLNEYHPFATAYTVHANIDMETFNQAIRFSDTDPGSAEFLTALRVIFDKDGNPDQPNALSPVQNLLHALEKILLLFQKLKLTAKDIRFTADHQRIFGIEELEKLNLENIQSLRAYSDLLPGNEEEKLTVRRLLLDYLPETETPFFERDSAATDLADIWQVDSSLIDSLIKSLTLPETAVEALTYLRKALDYCLTLGINGFSLLKLVADNNNYKEIESARDVALGAFSSKYEDANIRREKLEPYQDRINVLKRDALCDYILAKEKSLQFKDRNDIYSFFLLDVEMSSCFRTSRLVCGLSSLQLYVHRVFANLEQSTDIKVLEALASMDEEGSDDSHLEQIRKEWDWRKNYRVWEANRKVFLYPENYLEPDLRDNKTPIFKELEDELLQEKITEESAEAAYRKYLTQFSELARLRISGNYYHKKTDTYYFFGRTTQDPPQYYYRMWKEQEEWTPWEKIELGINAEYVSAIIHRGKLYLFWIERKETEKNTVYKGNSIPLGWTFEAVVWYSFLDEKGSWQPPQHLECHKDFFNSNVLKKENISIEKILSEKELVKSYRKVYLIGNDENINISITPLGYIVPGQHQLDSLSLYRLDMFNNDVFKISDVITPNSVEGNFIRLQRGNPNSVFYNMKIWLSEGWTTELYNDPFFFYYNGSDDTTICRSFSTVEFQPDIDVISAKLEDFIITLGNQQYLTQWKLNVKLSVEKGIITVPFPHRNVIRLTTSLADELGKTLLLEDIESFLSTKTQRKEEKEIGVQFKRPWSNYDASRSSGHIDFKGSYGSYYRELFFHIPFLIAHHLNANQKFKEAKWWYERIFDPTGTETPNSENPNERNWRYLEFRDLSISRIKDILTADDEIKKYEEDSFSPHAIARLRMTAYQKTIVMKYIDNLLDWGDSLFAQDSMESINEATMLYVLAADILGKRPVQLGKCDTVPDAALTYKRIAAEMDEDDDFLLTMENWHTIAPVEKMHGLLESHLVNNEIREWSLEEEQPIRPSGTLSAIQPEYTMQPHATVMAAKNTISEAIEALVTAPRPPQLSLMKLSMQVFCVPPNDDLHKYWDRVEDRLFKIRHCMNISGIRRQLALFQPPIDPMMLVRAKAAGLSMDDILSMLGAQLPPYRFSFLLDKAKQYTQTVQSFGSALLSALEKKDVEELTLLRSVHERNIMQLSKEIKTQQLAEAQCQYQATLETKSNVQNKIDYYDGLVAEGLTGWENVQSVAKHTSTGLQIAGATFFGASSLMYLIPQLGSPFAIKYGGKETGDSMKAWAETINQMSRIAEAIAASAGLQASWNRRDQEWKQQLTLAQQEIKQVEQQCLAADIRQQIAEKDLEIHKEQMEQADFLDNFYKNKFTNLGLYTYLSTNLNRLYREAYNIAYDMAKMAEKAYQFERDDDSSMFIAGDNWQYDRAGLLAGERLLLQLQHMEKAYLEKNTRRLEMTQSFSLALLDPNALKDLRDTGKCESFWIPEIAYDLVYPGQYKRIIKSVRLSIPCVTGPHTNIGATLTLVEQSKIRKEANLNDDSLVPVTYQSNTSIATSSSLNDSGVFELNFRDERYLPFEGAGAISQWKLSLPDKIRQFDYNTISDVVVHVSYTALDGGEPFKGQVEGNVIEKFSAGVLRESSGNQPDEISLIRVFSLTHEFPDAFHRLLTDPESPQSTKIEIKQEHFPYFMSKFDLSPASVTVYVRRKGETLLTLKNLKINGENVDFNPPGDPENDIEEGTTSATGELPGTWIIASGKEGEEGGLKREEIADILLAVQYKAEEKS